ncbi:MAG TPA: DUF983 domain-containing protein [Longimicrobiales bacterium]
MTNPAPDSRDLIQQLSGSRPLTRRAALLCGRALRRRCPVCGRGRLFRGWTSLRRRCDVCGLILERGEVDYFIGAYMLNLIIAELIVVALMLIVLAVTWPRVPWTGMLWGIVILTVPAVYATYPYSRSLWLALDLLFRPPEPADFAPDAEVLPSEQAERRRRP